MSKDMRYTLLLSLTAVIWGVGFVAQRAAMYHMGPLTFNGVRFILGGLSLIPVIMVMEKGGVNRATVIAGSVGGCIVFVAAGLQQWGISVTGSASVAGFISGMYIVLVPILGMLVGRKASLFVWIGAVSATAGMYFMSVPVGTNTLDLGSILLLAGAFGWAIHILVVDRFVVGIKPISFSVVQCLICGLLSLTAAFIIEDVQFSQIQAGYLPIIYSAFISVGIAYTLQIVGQKYVPPGRAAIIFSMESVMAAVAEAVLLGIFLDGRGYAGGGLIFAGILISQIQRRRNVSD